MKPFIAYGVPKVRNIRHSRMLFDRSAGHPSASSYASSETSSSFLSYFAGTTPDSEAKRVRLKTVLFLQGSPLYDPAVIRQRLLAADGDSGKGQVLSLEMAIVEGKVRGFSLFSGALSSFSIIFPYLCSWATISGRSRSLHTTCMMQPLRKRTARRVAMSCR